MKLEVFNLDGSPEAASGCAARAARLADSPPAFPQLEGKHPCFSTTGEGHARSARLHLPVSPACSIYCNFCKRDFNSIEHRPGVARGLLSPQQAIDVVERALVLCPSINVVGIAGPGDTLVTDHAIHTFEMVQARFPQLINCLSTNGLLLLEKADRIVAAGVKTVTVTVNAVDPAIQAKICSRIHYQGRRLQGIAAAELLISNQMTGIRRVAELGAVVKVNSVLIPGINEDHIGEIASRVRAAGASVINVIPLIPQHEISNLPAPDFIQVHDARAAAAEHLTVFTHCQRCRADACGIPGVGPDYAEQLYDKPLAAATFSHG